MCLGIPGKIIKKKGTTALVSFSGNKRNISLKLLKEANVGEYILVHAGFAIAKIDKDKALENEKLIKEILNETKRIS